MHSNEITIAKLTLQTTNELFQILEELNEEPLPTATQTKLTDDFNNDRFKAFFLYEKNVLAGCAVVVDTYSIAKASKVLYLNELYIRMPFRGKGYGKVLFEYIAQYAKNNGYIRLEWRTAKDNTVAQNLYQKYPTNTDWVFYALKLSDWGL